MQSGSGLCSLFSQTTSLSGVRISRSESYSNEKNLFCPYFKLTFALIFALIESVVLCLKEYMSSSALIRPENLTTVSNYGVS